MKRARSCSRRLVRTLVVTAACGVVVFALAGAALASTGSPNYGNFNPLTGTPYEPAAKVHVRYGGFNPLSGRPDSAPAAANAASRSVQLAPAPEPAARVVHTVVREDGSQTLALSLAGAALLVAIAGMGYTVIRLSGAPRPAR